MNQNENPVFGGHTDVDIAILRFRIVDIWIGKQKRVIEQVRPTICHTAILSRMQQELDFHGFVWKNDAPVVCAIKDSGIQ